MNPTKLKEIEKKEREENWNRKLAEDN